MTSRSDRFRQRVQKERETLEMVGQFIKQPRLHGLSDRTIKIWQEQALSSKVKNAGSITALLLEISNKLKLTADLSKTAFDDEKEIVDIDSILENLSITLQQ